MRMRRFSPTGLLLLVPCLLVGGVAGECQAPRPLIQAPRDGELALAGDVAARISLPGDYVAGSLVALLDGVDVSARFAVEPDESVAVATLPDVPPGSHELRVRLEVLEGASFPESAVHAFETVELDRPDECEVLNQVECLLPYPSSRFLADDPTSVTGYRLELPQTGIPRQLVLSSGHYVDLPAAAFAARDGYAPMVQILMHFPQGVDLAASGVPRLFEHPSRSTDLRSLDPDSPTVLVRAEDGSRVLHWAENDARSGGDPSREIFYLRPGRSLERNERYIVAVRHLLDRNGQPVRAEPVFAALRDGRPTSIPAVEARRAHMEDVFARLEAAGIPRDDLVLAFDFHTASDHNVAGQMLSMRDQAFEWLADQDPGSLFQVDAQAMVEHDCSQPGQFVWREVRGTYKVPLFLSADPETDPLSAGMLQVGPDGFTPRFSGVTQPPFAISIPCAARDAEQPVHAVVIGHGLFGDGPDFALQVPQIIGEAVTRFGATEPLYITGGTNWRGLSSPDFSDPFASDPKPSFIINTIAFNLPQFEALPDRLRQGQLNQLVLGRMMKLGLFDADPAFRAPDGHGVFRTDQDMYYFGISLGGIMGLMHLALSPDVEAGNVDVPAANFSLLLQRATPFLVFQKLLDLTVSTDPMIQGVGLALLGEMWQTGESAAYVGHITGDRLEGSGPPPRVLLTMAWLDQQVSNQATEITARTLGLPMGEGSFLHDLPLIPERSGPLRDAFYAYDTGFLDPQDPAQQAAGIIPPLANLPPQPNRCDPHPNRVRIPASLIQLGEFLRPGGSIVNACDGICDADPTLLPGPDGNDFALERPEGKPDACDPRL